MFEITNEQYVEGIGLAFVTAAGRPGKVDVGSGTPDVGVTNSVAGEVRNAAYAIEGSGLSFDFYSADGASGVGEIVAVVDVDLGEGTKTLEVRIAYSVTTPEVTAATVTIGEVKAKPIA